MAQTKSQNTATRTVYPDINASEMEDYPKYFAQLRRETHDKIYTVEREPPFFEQLNNYLVRQRKTDERDKLLNQLKTYL